MKGLVEAVEQRIREVRERLAPQYVPAASLEWPVEWNDAAPARIVRLPEPIADGLVVAEQEIGELIVTLVYVARCGHCGRRSFSPDRPSSMRRCYRCRKWVMPEALP